MSTQSITLRPVAYHCRNGAGFGKQTHSFQEELTALHRDESPDPPNDGRRFLDP